jgi:hypothetical protein
MPDPWETISVTVGADSTLKQKMAAFNADLDAVSEKGYNAVPRCK